jgi:hypothetical protein
MAWNLIQHAANRFGMPLSSLLTGFELFGTRRIYGGQKTCLKRRRISKYMPHQGKQEIARRLRQQSKLEQLS